MQSVASELDQLDRKIMDMVLLCKALETENAQLKRRLAAAEKNTQGLANRMSSARTRLERLILQLPEEDRSGD